METHVAALAVRLAARGHEVEVLTQQKVRGATPIECIEGVTVRRFPLALPAPIYALAPGIWRYLRRHGARYDLIHAHSYHAFPALLATLAGRRPLVLTPHYHGGGHTPLGRALHLPYRGLGALMLERADAIICVSHSEATLLLRHFPAAADRITEIPNGVDVAAIRGAQPFPGQQKHLILSAGRLAAYKGVDRVLGALARLDDRFELCAIGDGPARADLEAVAARLGVKARVHFLGQVDQALLYRWYRTAAVYASLSSQEAFGMTLLEALAAGAAVIASDIPAHREVLRMAGPVRAALVPVDAPSAEVAAAMQAMAENPPGTREGPDIRSWDDVVQQTLMVYDALL
ncbi:MAG: glycosyltransferase family 4 protein [Chloroflexota bacterium]|nr:glycosyltransferase family 4 protein [Chloroflexota bacterium]